MSLGADQAVTHGYAGAGGGAWTCVYVACVSLPQPLQLHTNVTDTYWAVVCIFEQTLEISPLKHHSSTYFQHVRTSNRPLQ